MNARIFLWFLPVPPGCRSHITPHLHIPGQFFVSVLYRLPLWGSWRARPTRRNYTLSQGEADSHVGLCPPRNDKGGRKPPRRFRRLRLREMHKSTLKSQLTCHCETSANTGRGNPHPLTQQLDYTLSQGEADSHVGLRPLATAALPPSPFRENDRGGRKPPRRFPQCPIPPPLQNRPSSITTSYHIII